MHLSIFEFILYFGTQKLHWIRKSAHVTSKGVSNVLSCYHVALRRNNVWSGIFILSSNLCVFLLNSSKYLDPDFFHLHDLKLNFLKFVLVETLIILKMIFQVMLWCYGCRHIYLFSGSLEQKLNILSFCERIFTLFDHFAAVKMRGKFSHFAFSL